MLILLGLAVLFSRATFGQESYSDIGEVPLTVIVELNQFSCNLVSYEVQLKVDDSPPGSLGMGAIGTGDRESITIVVQTGRVYQARVRGGDALGNFGPWSSWSEPLSVIEPHQILLFLGTWGDSYCSYDAGAEFPETVALGEWSTLTAFLKPKSENGPGMPSFPPVGGRPAPEGLESGMHQWFKQGSQITAHVFAAGFDTDGPSMRVLDIGDLSQGWKLQDLRLKSIRPGPQEILITFSQNARYIGNAVVHTVVQGPAGESSDPTSNPISNESIKEKEEAGPDPVIKVSKSSTPPDLQILVFEVKSGGDDTKLIYNLQSPNRTLNLGFDSEMISIGISPKDWVDQAFLELEEILQQGSSEATADMASRHVISTGRGIYDNFFPDNLKAILREEEVETILIVSEEPNIPWEMAYIDDPTDLSSGQFLGEKYAVTRWLNGTGEAPQIIPVDNIATFGVTEDPLLAPSVTREIGLLEIFSSTGSQVQSLNPKFSKVLDVLCNSDMGLIHFACHGKFKGDFSEIILSDGSLKVIYLNDPDCGRPGSHPLIFLNACQTGRGATSLRGMSGWPSGFLDIGAGAFIGPQWSVQTDFAYKFAEFVYMGLSKGLPLGKALQQARIESRKYESQRQTIDPAYSWLAYTAYGDPNAKLSN